MKTKLLFLSLLLTGCASTTKIPIDGSWFTAGNNGVTIETQAGKKYEIRLKDEWLNVSMLGDSLTVKKETLPFGIWPVYSYPAK